MNRCDHLQYAVVCFALSIVYFYFLYGCLEILYMKNNCWFKRDHFNKVTIFLFTKLLFFYDVNSC